MPKDHQTGVQRCAASVERARAPKLETDRGGVNFLTRGRRPFAPSCLAVTVLVVLAGCASKPNPAPVDAGIYWPTYLGNYARTPFLNQRITSEPPNIVWEMYVGPALRGMPVVTDEVIIAAASDRRVHSLNPVDGSTFWRSRIDGPPNQLLVVGDVIYAGTEADGRLVALDAVLGKDTWKFKLPSIEKPITLAGDTLFAATEDGSLFAIETGEEEPIWRAFFPRAASASPLVLDGWIVYVAYDSLYVLDRIDASRRAAAYSSEIFIGEAASDGEVVYLATELGSLTAWSLPDLEFIWQASGFGNFVSGPVLADSVGYAVTRIGSLLKFDIKSGTTRIIADASSTVLAPPTVVANGVLVGTLEGRLHFFSRDGEPIWDVELEGSIEEPVFVHKSRVIVPMYGKRRASLGSGSNGKIVLLR